MGYVCAEKGYKGAERNPSPEVLAGDPQLTQRLIDSLDFKHKYTSGYLSFAQEDQITPEMEQEIMSRFEGAAFTGLERDQYNILWVRHAHTGRTELHFVVPRVELSTGKSLNIAPPRRESRQLFDTLKDSLNIEHGLSSPQDPARARSGSLPDHIEKINAANKRLGLEEVHPRELLTQALEARVADGLIQSRSDLTASLKADGFEIHRQGKEYISVRGDLTEDKSWRLKGAIFSERFRDIESLQGEVQRATGRDPADLERERERLEEKLETLVARRGEYNRGRYGAAENVLQAAHGRSQERDQEVPDQERSGPSEEVGDLELCVDLDRGVARIERLGGEVVLGHQVDQVKTPGIGAEGRSGGAWEVGHQADPGMERGQDGSREVADDSPWVSGRGLQQEAVHTSERLGEDNEPDRTDITGEPGRFRSTLEASRARVEAALGRIREQAERLRDRVAKGLGRLRDVLHGEAQELPGGLREVATREAHGFSGGIREHARGEDTRARGADEWVKGAAYDLERQAGQAVRADKEVGMIHQNRANELERFKKEINLPSYAVSMGYQVDLTVSSRNSLTAAHSEGDKVIIAQAKDGHWIYFSTRDPQDKGSIIDFHQNRTKDNLGQVRQELRPWLGEQHREEQERFSWVKPVEKDKEPIVEALSRMKNLTRSNSYSNHRGIDGGVLKEHRFEGQIRTDAKRNMIFPHQDAEGFSGFEAKNFKFKGFSKGGEKGLWRSNMYKSDERLVVTESAIDALSYHQLHGDEKTRYVSIAGTMSDKQREYLKESIERMPEGASIVIATDQDKAGHELAEQIQELVPGREMIRDAPQQGKDWNEELQKSLERELDRGYSL